MHHDRPRCAPGSFGVAVRRRDADHVAARKLRVSAGARAEKPGQILETELDYSKGRYVCDVEILDERGQVWELKLSMPGSAR